MKKCLWKFDLRKHFWYQSEMKIFLHWLTFGIVFFGLIHILACRPLVFKDQMHSVEVSENSNYRKTIDIDRPLILPTLM